MTVREALERVLRRGWTQAEVEAVLQLSEGELEEMAAAPRPFLPAVRMLLKFPGRHSGRARAMIGAAVVEQRRELRQAKANFRAVSRISADLYRELVEDRAAEAAWQAERAAELERRERRRVRPQLDLPLPLREPQA